MPAFLSQRELFTLKLLLQKEHKLVNGVKSEWGQTHLSLDVRLCPQPGIYVILNSVEFQQ